MAHKSFMTATYKTDKTQQEVIKRLKSKMISPYSDFIDWDSVKGEFCGEKFSLQFPVAAIRGPAMNPKIKGSVKKCGSGSEITFRAYPDINGILMFIFGLCLLLFCLFMFVFKPPESNIAYITFLFFGIFFVTMVPIDMYRKLRKMKKLVIKLFVQPNS